MESFTDNGFCKMKTVKKKTSLLYYAFSLLTTDGLA